MAAVTERQQQLVLELPLPAREAQLLHHVDRRADYRWKGYITIHHRESSTATLHQRSYPVDKMVWAINQHLKSKAKTHDLYISQHTYRSRTRSTNELLSLNLGPVDLDTYNTEWAAVPKQQVVAAVLRRLEQHSIPLPSYIVDSGRGLQVKWIWTEPLSPKALPRWQVALRYLVEEVLHDFGADVHAILPTQIMRMIGSTNLKVDGSIIDILWVNGHVLDPVQVDFNAWANAVLPYSRDEVKAFYAKMRQYDAWKAENKTNMVRLLAERPGAVHAKKQHEAWKQLGQMLKLDLSPVALSSINDLVAGEIWQRRLAVMDRLIEIRGYQSGIPEGQRFQWTWIAANAYGWVNRDQKRPLRADLVSWCKSYIPSYSHQEAVSAASSVLKRENQQYGQDSGLYKMKEATFLGPKMLNITADERNALTLFASRQNQEQLERWAIGSMNFEKMKGLSFDEYKEETRRRQSEAAERTNAMARSARSPLQEKAHQLSAEGLSQRAIAGRLGVSQKSISNWLKL